MRTKISTGASRRRGFWRPHGHGRANVSIAEEGTRRIVVVNFGGAGLGSGHAYGRQDRLLLFLHWAKPQRPREVRPALFQVTA